ncbi:hypothetical protein V4D30_01575 [Thermodesulfovibrio sp. 3907-1M]|uniref:Uncharacterized protein n=1 Tax=Thermodesulfovibrio autotrophicus TaxID=3118333 RepID=A0AAU8GWX7_9BACT
MESYIKEGYIFFVFTSVDGEAEVKRSLLRQILVQYGLVISIGGLLVLKPDDLYVGKTMEKLRERVLKEFEFIFQEYKTNFSRAISR